MKSVALIFRAYWEFKRTQRHLPQPLALFCLCLNSYPALLVQMAIFSLRQREMA